MERYSNDMSDQDLGHTSPSVPDPASTAREHKVELEWLDGWEDADLDGL